MSLIADFIPNFAQNDLSKIADQSNQGAGKPSALILLAKLGSEAFTNHPSCQFFMATLAKTHRLAIQLMQEKADIQNAIRSSEHPIDLLVIYAHGQANRFGIQPDLLYQEADVRPEDFQALPSEAKIVLISCHTGKRLAQKIADVSQRTVFAPTEFCNLDLISWSYCHQHHQDELKARNEKQMQMVGSFQSGHAPVICQEQTDAEYFADLITFLKEKAQQGSIKAAYALAQLDSAHAEQSYLCVAHVGDREAQFIAATYAEKRNDIEAAMDLYLQAARQGHATAKYNLGLIYLKRSDFDQAITFMLPRAHEGLADAQYNLGRIYDEKHNKQQAIYWYQKAAAQGLPDAQHNLALLTQPSCVIL
jgi:hypothetical protein